MKRLSSLLNILLLFILMGCNTNIIDFSNFGSTANSINGCINAGAPEQWKGCSVVSASGEILLEGNSFTMEDIKNDKIQTFVVCDEADNALLIARCNPNEISSLTIDVKTTALALVTLHPLLSPINTVEYNQIIEEIVENSHFEALCVEVSKGINERKPLFDVNNKALLLALNDLLDALSAKIDDTVYSDSLDIIADSQNTATRAIYENPKVYPLHADLTGMVLTLRNVGLTPSYYGVVVEPNGGETPFSVPARSDYGGMDLFKENMDEFMLGEPRQYRFTSDGEYWFLLSRMNASATADFYLRLANSILTSLGLDLGNDVVQELGNTISRAMINAGSGVNDQVTDPMEWLGIAYGAVVTWMEHDAWEAIGKGGIVRLGNILSGSLNFYNKIKGVFNASVRIAHALSAPEEINFCLCRYNNMVSTCSEAEVSIVGGNEQVGYARQKLLEPLVVSVKTLEDGELTISNSYHRVLFEVVSGNGFVDSEYVSVDNNQQASTYWTLGESGEQKVKVSVVDIVTEKEISEPVYFTASLDSASITIRLDWSKHSCNTDIDLHVVDPYGEEIYYRHMESASGGYLDRDDTVGPGPEHVRWANAPTGTYKIYVHYYPNEAEDRSITSYKVTVNTSEREYRPVTGSIAYNQMIGIGQFTIGEQQTRSTISTELMATDEVIENKVYPKK